MLRLELTGRRGRIKRWCLDVVKEDMKWLGVREEEAEGGVKWKHVIGWGHPWREQPEGKPLQKQSNLTVALNCVCRHPGAGSAPPGGPSQDPWEVLSHNDGWCGDWVAEQERERQVSVCSAVSERLVALLHGEGRQERTWGQCIK